MVGPDLERLMTKLAFPKATLALGVLTVMGLAAAGLAGAQPTQTAQAEPDLLGGPKGPPVGKAKPAPPLTAPSARAPTLPRTERPRLGASETAPFRVNTP